MEMKTLFRSIAVYERCSNCRYGKVIKECSTWYDLEHVDCRCYARSRRGRDCSSLRYSCPIGKPLEIDEKKGPFIVEFLDYFAIKHKYLVWAKDEPEAIEKTKMLAFNGIDELFDVYSVNDDWYNGKYGPKDLNKDIYYE